VAQALEKPIDRQKWRRLINNHYSRDFVSGLG
jgi:hypothetical protein